jgi:hypothetical protein
LVFPLRQHGQYIEHIDFGEIGAFPKLIRGLGCPAFLPLPREVSAEQGQHRGTLPVLRGKAREMLEGTAEGTLLEQQDSSLVVRFRVNGINLQ